MVFYVVTPAHITHAKIPARHEDQSYSIHDRSSIFYSLNVMVGAHEKVLFVP
jgi:hypothetical protein